MESVSIHDKIFRLNIPAEKIRQVVSGLATKLNSDLAGKDILYLVVLNGAFIFASDLLRAIRVPGRISFVRLASYEKTNSTGKVRELIGIHEVLEDKTVVIIEDVVDSGNTLQELLQAVRRHKPAEIRIVSLLFKPDAYEHSHKIDYVGFRIPNDFVVGYGLDYDGLGRQLKDIYTLVES